MISGMKELKWADLYSVVTCLLRFFKISITAGTLLTMVLRATVTRDNAYDRSISIPIEKRRETIRSGI